MRDNGQDPVDDIRTSARNAGGLQIDEATGQPLQCPLHDHGYDHSRLGHVTAELTSILPDVDGVELDQPGDPQNDMSAHDQDALGLSNTASEFKLT